MNVEEVCLVESSSRKKKKRRQRKIENDWLPADTERLLHLVEGYTFLWDPSQTRYKEKRLRDSTFQEIGQKMQRSGNDCKQKWENLRAQFRAYYAKIKQQKSGKEAADNFKVKWKYFALMTFLVAVYESNTKTVSNLCTKSALPSSPVDADLSNDPLGTAEDDFYSEIDIKNEFHDIEENGTIENSMHQQQNLNNVDFSKSSEQTDLDNVDFSDSSNNGHDQSIIEGPPCKKNKSKIYDSTVSNNQQNILYSPKCDDTHNEFYYFGLNIAAQLKNLPLENALLLQAKIQNLLTNERLKVLKNSTTEQDASPVESKGQSTVPAVCNNESKNETPKYGNEANVSATQKINPTTRSCISVVSFSDDELNPPNNHITRALHEITENQLFLQDQLRKIQSFCPGSREQALEKILRQNLVISKESLKSLKKIFDVCISPMAIEMGSFFPLSSITEVEEIENKIQIEDYEDALKMYLISKIGNQNLDEFFRNLISDELLDAFNWDGVSGKQSLKCLRLFNVVLNDVFCHMTRKEYETEVRKFVELSHNRFKHRRLKEYIYNI